MTNALAKLGTESGIAEAIEVARRLKDARGLLPESLKSEGEILAVILAGQELGLPPMAALRGLQVVRGKVIVSYDTMVALLRRNGYRIEWPHTDSRSATVKLTAPDGAEFTLTFDETKAKVAGLWDSPTWKKYPDTMLRARAISGAARAFAGDILLGVYTEDEGAEIRRGAIRVAVVDDTKRLTPANTVEIIDPETGEIMTPQQVRDASKKENARQDEEFAPLAEKLIGDLQRLTTATQLESHVQHNWGHARVYPRSKAAARYWTALQRAAERFAVPLSKLRDWCESAPSLIESTIEPDHDDAYEAPDAKVGT